MRVILIFSVILGFLLSAPVRLIAAPGGAKRAPRGVAASKQDEGMTRLRASSPIVVTRSARSTREIQHINTEVSNVGDSLASGVEVLAELPGGVVVQMQGPKKLRPRQRAVYLARGKLPFTGGGSVRVKASCEQCWR